MGKTTAITEWDGKTLLDNQWMIQARFLDYNRLRYSYTEFINKRHKPFMELAYSLTHLLRTITEKPLAKPTTEQPTSSRVLLLTERSCISNLVYYLLFFLKGEISFDNLFHTFLTYDRNKQDLLPEVRQTIDDVEIAVKIVGQELTRLHCHIIIALPANAFILVDRIKTRNHFDADFVTLDYIRSQEFLFLRFARLLPSSMVSIMRIEKFFTLDAYQLTNHLQHNDRFC